ncbi:hypothetical protein [Mesorhizobium sp. STM 4661]|uniref:hypothetical protein n=1 Tax=Mesorhizobium sp. STM 4661 TaxID=1297570 RepID=UPI0002BD44F5|nr:hypothetical protein [Mesorhizobium sp. STM 4661]CCV12967.1 hypothetical protein MESS4_510134 [Mesorhizobium sp. STM 4661]
MTRYTIRDNKTNEIRNNQTFENYCSAFDELQRIGANWQRTLYLHDNRWRDDWNRAQTLDLTEFGFEPIKDHFLMLASDDSADAVYVTYFQDEWAGAKRKRTSPMKLGRYLKQFYPQLTDDEVTTQSTTIFTKLLKMDLQLAYSADDIQAIYEESHAGACGSCMSHRMDSGHWNSWQKDHPVRAYAGPDLALAYIRKPVTGELLGRALVWPEKKKFGSTYGNYDKIRAALRQAGYTSDGNFDGARMTRLVQRRNGNTVYLACPYLDNGNGCHDNGEYLVMGRNSAYDRKDSSQNGYITIQEYRCAISGELIPAAKAFEVMSPDGLSTVSILRDLRDTHTEYHHGSRWLKSDNDDDYIVVGDGKRLPRGVVSNYYRKCAVTKKFYLPSEGMNTNDGWVCNQVYFRDYVVCQVSKSVLKKDRAVWMEHGAWWHPEMLRTHGVQVEGKNYARLLQAA